MTTIPEVQKLDAPVSQEEAIASLGRYGYGWADSDIAGASAQRGLSDRKEIGTANHAEHAKGSGALQGQDDAFDLKARLAEVEQQTECKPVAFR